MGIETLYIHAMTVTRPAKTADGQGGWAVGYETIGLVNGRLRPASASERISADQQQARITHVWYCAPTEDIRRGDLLSGEGQTVEVLAVREPSHMGHHLEVDCVEIQKELEQEAGS